MSGLLPPKTPDELQKAYREKRRRYAWRHGKPYSEDLHKPAPGVLDGIADEEG